MAEAGAPNTAPIIVVKKKGGHGGHHGGAWKVAYADFVTALMALFIVLWLVNAKPTVKEAVAGYFNDPKGFGKLKGSAMDGTGKGAGAAKTVDISAKMSMDEIKKKIEEAMKRMPELQKLKNQIEMTITNEGLRIEMLETEKGVFFDSGSPHPTEFGKDLLTLLAKEIGKLPNHVLIEGHTDARPYVSLSGYSNWELSADRANSARQIMQGSGIRADQVSEIRGYGAQKLRKPADPDDASNRRISLTVKYIDLPPPNPAAVKAAHTDEVEHGKSEAHAGDKRSPMPPPGKH